MKGILTLQRIIYLVSIVFLLAACGGGGSDGETGGGNTGMIGSAGGTIDLGGQMTLEVPAGALTMPIQISAKTLDPIATQTILDDSGQQTRVFMAGASFFPSGQQFSKPVKVTLPAYNIPPGTEVPIHFKYNQDWHAYYPTNTEVTVSPDNGTITFTLNEFSDHAMAGVSDSMKAKCIANGEAPCRCGDFHVVSDSLDKIYTTPDGTCNVARDTGHITYLQCVPQVTESWEFIEHTAGCVPKMTLVPDLSAIGAGESTALTTTVTYAQKPMPSVEVNLLGDGLTTVSPSPIYTDATGTAQTTATAGNAEGTSLVEAAAVVTYEPVKVSINGQLEPVIPKEKTVQAQTEIFVDAPPILQVSILPGVYGNYLLLSEETLVSIAILDPNPATGGFSLVPSTDVLLSASDGTLGSPAVRTTSLGEVTTSFIAPNTPGPVTIIADATVSTLNDRAEPVTYQLDGSDVIDVLEKPVKRWDGHLEAWVGGSSTLPGGGMGPPEPVGNFYLWFMLTMDFTVDMDPDNFNPSAANPNISGTGVAQVEVVYSGPITSSFGTGSNYTEITTEYINRSATPFQAAIQGLVPDPANPQEMYLNIANPVGDPTRIASATRRTTITGGFSAGVTTDPPLDWLWYADPEVPAPLDTTPHDPLHISLGPGTTSSSGWCEILTESGAHCRFTMTLTPE